MVLRMRTKANAAQLAHADQVQVPLGSGRLCSLILQLFDAALLIKCHDYSSRIVHYALNYA